MDKENRTRRRKGCLENRKSQGMEDIACNIDYYGNIRDKLSQLLETGKEGRKV